MAAEVPLRKVCVIGGGTIGSLLAGHLSRVCEVWVLTRRAEHAERLESEGLRISGKSELVARVRATSEVSELPAFDLGIVAVKATDLVHVAEKLTGLAPEATIMTIQNGLGAEHIVARHGDWPLISSVTFMSGTRRSDAHVEYELDTATWLGPWASTIAEHHERYDGHGYPAGLAGKSISHGGRIVAVADAYDVMTTPRPYRKQVGPAAARQELTACAGSQFDPEVVKAFLAVSIWRVR